MLFNPSRPRTRAKRLSSTNIILIGGEILRELSFCLVMILLASAIALTGTPSGVGASSNRLSPAASLDRIAPTTVYPFLPNVKVTDESSPYKYQVEPTMVINRSGTVFAGWKETDGPDAAGFRVGSSYSIDQGQTWAPNILMNQTHPNLGCGKRPRPHLERRLRGNMGSDHQSGKPRICPRRHRRYSRQQHRLSHVVGFLEQRHPVRVVHRRRQHVEFRHSRERSGGIGFG